MPITQMQLESIKAANLAKSVNWEAAKFLPGDIVLTHGHRVRRTENAWICTKMGLQYATLSRWARAKLGRTTFNVKWCTFLMVGSEIVQMCCVPPPGERHLYSPWTAGRDRYYPVMEAKPAITEPSVAAPAPATTEPSGVNSAQQNERQSGVEAAATNPPISRLDSIDGRLDDIDASTTEQNMRLKNLEGLTESSQEDFHRRLIVQQGRIDALEAEMAEMKDRLLATAVVAAHIGLFKDRIAALEAKA
jgi:hypothetical protein